MKTGAIKLSMSDYLSEHGVSQSRLKLLARSPAHLKYAIEHPEPPTPAQTLGHVFDAALFEPDAIANICYVRPSHYVGEGTKKPWHNGAKFCKEWNEAHKDREIIPQADFASVQAMVGEILKHPAAALVLKEGKSGFCLFSEDAETGLQLKGRPDWMSGNVIADLKSCVDASPNGFARAVANFGYEIQAAFYLDLAAVLKLEKEHFFFIACEKEPPYAVAVYELDEESINIGRTKYRRLLARYLQCVVADTWPGYSRHVEVLTLPAWSKKSEFDAISLEDSPVRPALEVA